MNVPPTPARTNASHLALGLALALALTQVACDESTPATSAADAGACLTPPCDEDEKTTSDTPEVVDNADVASSPEVQEEDVAECTEDSDCEPPEDWDHCQGPPACQDGVCVADIERSVVCEPSPAPCVKNTCQPSTGTCRLQNAPEEVWCEVDNNVCTVEQCDGAGFCVTVEETPDCIPCSKDSGCNDNDACTDERCDQGQCVYESLDCDDGDACTTDICDTNSGCVHADTCGVNMCGTTAPSLVCNQPAEPATGMEPSMLTYSCLEELELPGAEVIFPFIAPADTELKVSWKAAPSGHSHFLLLEGTCGAAHCTQTKPLSSTSQSVKFSVKEGQSYWLVADSELVGLTSVSDITINCKVPEICDDGEDNDWNGLVDCQDSACVMPGTPCQNQETSCDDGVDNDADGETDCEDPTCNGIGVCEWPETSCTDGIDNDADGQSDCNDLDCGIDAACKEGCQDQAMPLLCGQQLNHIDSWQSSLDSHSCGEGAYTHNDIMFRFKAPFNGSAKLNLQAYKEGADLFLYEGDCATGTCVDSWPLSGGAWGEMVTTFNMVKDTEYTLVLDSKPIFEWPDPWLNIESLSLECSGPEVCDDGVDNDWNGQTDCGELSCLTGGAPCELSEATCDDGFDNDGDGQTDCEDIQCHLVEDSPCESPESTCDDGVDNDGNGKTDCADLVCIVNESFCEQVETLCDDGLDNDGDGRADCDDASCALQGDGCPQTCGPDIVTLGCPGELFMPVVSEVSHIHLSPCGDAETPGAEVVFRLEPTFDGMLWFDTYGPTISDQTLITLLEGTCDMTNCIGTSSPFQSPSSLSNIPVEAGKTYYIVVDQKTEGTMMLDYVFIDCGGW